MRCSNVIVLMYFRLKVESQLISWFSKFDLDIGKKQTEFDEIMDGFNDERKQMDELQVNFISVFFTEFCRNDSFFLNQLINVSCIMIV